jgi:hypothetical protein
MDFVGGEKTTHRCCEVLGGEAVSLGLAGE